MRFPLSVEFASFQTRNQIAQGFSFQAQAASGQPPRVHM